MEQNKLVNKQAIFSTLTWPRRGKGSWNYEKVWRGYLASDSEPLQITYQFQPVVGQLGNIFTRGVGKYGTGNSGKKVKQPNILTVINLLTERNTDKEKKLAQLFLEYKKGDSKVLSEENLEKSGFRLPIEPKAKNKQVKNINTIAYLVCFQEVYRRKNQGYIQDGNSIQQVLDLPFGVAVASVLKLIADGYLRMHEVFDTDAPYGVFTGKSIMTKNFEKTVEKFNKLFVLFSKTYAHAMEEVFEFMDDIEENIVTILYNAPQNLDH